MLATAGKLLPALAIATPGILAASATAAEALPLESCGWDFRTRQHTEYQSVTFYPPGVAIPPGDDAWPLDDHGHIVIKPLHRRDYPSVKRLPQPVPVSVDLRAPDSGGTGERALIRDWEADTVHGCRLCASCTAFRRRDRGGLVSCMLAVPNGVTEATAEMFESV